MSGWKGIRREVKGPMLSELNFPAPKSWGKFANEASGRWSGWQGQYLRCTRDQPQSAQETRLRKSLARWMPDRKARTPNTPRTPHAMTPEPVKNWTGVMSVFLRQHHRQHARAALGVAGIERAVFEAAI